MGKKILFSALVAIVFIASALSFVSASQERILFIGMHTEEFRNFSEANIISSAQDGFDGSIIWTCDRLFNSTYNTQVTPDEIKAAMLTAASIIRARGDTPYMGLSCEFHRVSSHQAYFNETTAFLNWIGENNMTPVLVSLISSGGTGTTMAKKVADNSSYWTWQNCTGDGTCNSNVPTGSDPTEYLLNLSESNGWKLWLRSTINYPSPFRTEAPARYADYNYTNGILNVSTNYRLDFANETALQIQKDFMRYMSEYYDEYPDTLLAFGWEEPPIQWIGGRHIIGGFSNDSKNVFFNRTGQNLSIDVNWTGYGGINDYKVIEHNTYMWNIHFAKAIYDYTKSFSASAPIGMLLNNIFDTMTSVQPSNINSVTDLFISDNYNNKMQGLSFQRWISTTDSSFDFSKCGAIAIDTQDRLTNYYYIEYKKSGNFERRVSLANNMYIGSNGITNICLVSINRLDSILSSWNGTLILASPTLARNESAAILNWTSKGNSVYMPFYMEMDEYATLSTDYSLTTSPVSKVMAQNISSNDDGVTDAFGDLSGNRDYKKQLFVPNYNFTNASVRLLMSETQSGTTYLAFRLNNQSACDGVGEVTFSGGSPLHKYVDIPVINETCLPKGQYVNLTFWALNSTQGRQDGWAIRTRRDNSRNGTSWYDGNNAANPYPEGGAAWALQNFEHMIALEFYPNPDGVDHIIPTLGYRRNNVSVVNMGSSQQNMVALVNLWDMAINGTSITANDTSGCDTGDDNFTECTDIDTNTGRTYDEFHLSGETKLLKHNNSESYPVVSVPYGNGTFVVVKSGFFSGGFGNYHPDIDIVYYKDQNSRFMRNLIGYAIKKQMESMNGQRPYIIINANSSYTEGVHVGYDGKFITIIGDSSKVQPVVNLSTIASGADVYDVHSHRILYTDVSNGFIINATESKVLAIEPLKGYVFEGYFSYVQMQNSSESVIDYYAIPFTNNTINNTLGDNITIEISNIDTSRLTYQNGTSFVMSSTETRNVNLPSGQSITIEDLPKKFTISGSNKHIKISGNNTHLKILT